MQPRAAVVGTGFIGVVHVEALRRLGVEVAGVVGSSPERARAKAAPACRPSTTSLEALLADPRVDVVHLTTPNHLHYPQAKAALAAGKHVVCEKPLALTRRESARAARARRGERARPLHELQHPLLPAGAARRARASRAASSATSGTSTAATCRTGCCCRPTGTGGSSPSRGGALRAVADIGSHWLDLVAVRHRARRSRRVFADLATRDPGPAPAGRRGRDVRRVGRRASASPSRCDGGRRARPAALRGRRPGRVTVSQVSAGRRNHARVRDRRRARRARVELGAERGALDRPPRPPERAAAGTPRCSSRPPHAVPVPPVTPRASPTRSSTSTARSTRPSPRAACPPSRVPDLRRRPPRDVLCEAIGRSSRDGRVNRSLTLDSRLEEELADARRRLARCSRGSIPTSTCTRTAPARPPVVRDARPDGDHVTARGDLAGGRAPRHEGVSARAAAGAGHRTSPVRRRPTGAPVRPDRGPSTSSEHAIADPDRPERQSAGRARRS